MKQLLLILILSISQSSNAQIAMLKATGLLLPHNGGGNIIFDGGVEVKIKGQWTGQLSFSSSIATNYTYNREKTIVSPQLRYYFKKDAWLKSPYMGFVLQHHVGKDDEIDDSDYVDFKYTSYTKYGAGIILGHHIKVYKNFGIDLHLGVLREKGDNTVKVEEHSTLHTNPKTYTYMEKGAVNNRVFWGFNFYFAIN